jgi:hypothetical protein
VRRFEWEDGKDVASPHVERPGNKAVEADVLLV